MAEDMLEKWRVIINKPPVLQEHPHYSPLIEAVEQQIGQSERFISYSSRLPFKNCPAYETLKNLAGAEKLEAVLFLAKRVNTLQQKLKPIPYQDKSKVYFIDYNLLDALMRTRIEFPQDFSFRTLFDIFYKQSGPQKDGIDLHIRPFGCLVTHLEKQVKKRSLDESLRNDIQAILDEPAVAKQIGNGAATQYWGPDIGKAVKKLQQLLLSSNDEDALSEEKDFKAVKPAHIEAMAVSDYGLNDGERTEIFDGYTLTLRLAGAGTTELQWFKPDGTAQKSVPAAVKNTPELAARLKTMQDAAKQVKQASSIQRDRIDRLYSENIGWSMADFERYYLQHGLVSPIARKLLWSLDGRAALYVEGQWQDESGAVLDVSTQTQVRLWHPLDSKTASVLVWRERLEALQIRQPFKQAYREIYLLTDAEIHTRVYSNRMAAHLLKQHQFSTLAALRGWKYSLLGAYDDGRDGEIAEKHLPEHDLTAQFWINQLFDDSDSFNEAGIWNYVATDQVRFCDRNGNAVPLIDVPPLIFSEIMRDVDLFVGVASVGNDPEWQDGGPEGRQDYRNYWHSYSFGDLTEVAKTRKSVLERLLPRLKIRNVAKIDGKFLLVQGKKHHYKIHIGSGNILIAPADRYLCIVPGRDQDKSVGQVFLPFEGDKGLSVVLSKAFLLAEDDKITDPTILRQL